MVTRATRQPMEAEDCVHDAMLRLAARPFLAPTRVGSMLVRAALRIASDHDGATAQRAATARCIAAHIEAHCVTPEDLHASRETTAELLAALRQLPRREQNVLRLRAIADLATAEIAARLGISVKSVENTLARARSRLRHALPSQPHRPIAIERLRPAARDGGRARRTLRRRRRSGDAGGPARAGRTA